MTPRIESIQTGQARTVGTPDAADPLDRQWTSAIWKEPVEGRVWAGAEGLSGDIQVDRQGHGGIERALLLYAAEHYPKWRAEWGRRDVGPGGFGENLTVSGLEENTVCVGDVFQIGEARIEVSAPRGPCLSLVRRHRVPDAMNQVVASGRSGWYARVKNEGWVEKGVSVVLLDRPFPQWTIGRAAAVKRAKNANRAEAAQLAACPALAADWRAKLAG